MVSLIKYSILILSFALFGCQIQQVSLRRQLSEREIDNYLKGYNGYRVDHVDMDYIASCKIRIKTPEETVSGSCKITVSNVQQLRMEIFSPLGGMVMAVYMDEDLIQLLLRSQKTFYQMKNNDKNRRKRLKFVDLSVSELQEVLWGRKIDSNKTNLNFQLKDKKPFKIQDAGKSRGIDIYYKNWLDYRGVSFPKTIDIRDSNRKIFLKLVVTNLRLGYSEDLKISKIPPNYKLRS